MPGSTRMLRVPVFRFSRGALVPQIGAHHRWSSGGAAEGNASADYSSSDEITKNNVNPSGRYQPRQLLNPPGPNFIKSPSAIFEAGRLSSAAPPLLQRSPRCAGAGSATIQGSCGPVA